ncbi:hypothetical protein RFI_07303, partial [Reticulomyxa filosa]
YSNDKTTTTLFLFDEIGLAEQSPHNPLKILHQLLEHPKIAFVGISNWSLDAAKMNRMIMHSIPLMDHNGLMETAKVILKQSKLTFSEQAITKIITAYEKIIKDQTNAFKINENSDFFGARDFYALVKYQATLSEFFGKRPLEGYLRNFGGFDNINYNEQLQKILVEVLGKTKEKILLELKKWSPAICVQRNLIEKKCSNLADDLIASRHCMVISERTLFLAITFGIDILNYSQVFLFGSYFPQDMYSNITSYNQLNKIIDCMDTGKTVILHNLESIYESLYDMLNQRYQRRPSGNVYCRVALGTESRDCYVHENFKCVVVVQKEDAHSPNMPIAFLSRFEKQFISYRDSLPSNMESCIKSMRKMLLNKFKPSNLSDVFCGYCRDTLSSALLYLAVRKAKKANECQNDEKKESPQTTNLDTARFDEKELETELLDLLNPLCRPKIITNIQTDKDIKFYCLGDMIKIQQEKSKDQMVMILTNDMEHNIPMEWIHCTKKIRSFKKVEQFEKTIKAFFKHELPNDVLILQCRYTPKSKNQLEQIIHILQLEHYQFYNDSNNSQKQKLVILLIHSSRESSKKSIKELSGKSNKELSFPLIFRHGRLFTLTRSSDLKNNLFKIKIDIIFLTYFKKIKTGFFLGKILLNCCLL